MDPLIITATANISWLRPETPYPKTPGEIAEEACECREAGASICHTHAENRWCEVIEAIKGATDIIIQCGMSSLPISERMDAFRCNGEMISIILGHHDEAFVGRDFHVLHPRDELLEYMALCKEYGIRPEWEVWNTGSIWNLNYLIEKSAVKSPYFTTLFFGWPGGAWSPATIEEYLYRKKYMPAGSVVNVSIMGKQQIEIITAAITLGDHVRVGTEDYPYTRKGKLATTAELVAEVAQIAASIGRPVAAPEQARELIGLTGGKP